MTDTYKPSWVPEEENDKFACRVMYGVTGGHEGTPGVTVDKKDKVTPAIKRRKLEVDDYVEGVLKCDRAILHAPSLWLKVMLPLILRRHSRLSKNCCLTLVNRHALGSPCAWCR